MPLEFLYLGILMLTIGVFFICFKRPIYEAMFFGFIAMIATTNEWRNMLLYIKEASCNNLFYAIVAFLALATLLTETKIIDSCILIILSIFGRFKGGAGYVALIASSFMGALSGSAAGNAAATGVFTIPAMKKTGYPAHLAANVVMAASTMGNMIPPAGVIAVSFGVLDSLYPGSYSMSTYWILMWGISLWFIMQRGITIYFFCKYYKINPMPKNEIPNFFQSLKLGWRGLLVPVIIFLPFLLDALLKNNVFKAQLGEKGAYISQSTLLFTPGLAAIFILYFVRKKFDISPKNISKLFTNTLKSIVPVSITIFFSYCISNLFVNLNIGNTIGEYITSLNSNLIILAMIIPLFTALLGMILPGSSQVAIFGVTIITITTNAGGNPLLIAGMLPVITGAMEGMTPPLALCMYTAMGIAEAKLKETTKNCFIWVGFHYIFSVVMILGLLPIIGLN